jgi:electron transport complex protein RnfG
VKETLRLILTLSIICLVAGALLACVDILTRDRILIAQGDKKLAALKEVLPKHDNRPNTNVATVEHGGRTWEFFVAQKKGEFIGTAVETMSPAGYGGDISLMLGIDAEGKVKAISILGQKETPGLGANIETADFRNQFAQLSIGDTQWAVAKDGGDIDQITAATISSRAVVEAVKAAIDAYLANMDTINKTGL